MRFALVVVAAVWLVAELVGFVIAVLGATGLIR